MRITRRRLLILSLASALTLITLALITTVGIGSTSSGANGRASALSGGVTSKAKLAANQQPLVYNGVNQQQLATCIQAGANCLKTVSGLAACMQAGHNCNESYALGNSTPNALAGPVASNASLISKAKAFSIVDTDRPGVNSTSGYLTTYGGLDKAWPALAASTVVNPSRPVWVVKMTLSSPQSLNSASVPPGVKVPKVSAYVEVIDAATGVVTDSVGIS